ncbi:hypothetical protein Hanom_Chr10g00941081 [Helianthus anomalus]
MEPNVLGGFLRIGMQGLKRSVRVASGMKWSVRHIWNANFFELHMENMYIFKWYTFVFHYVF